MFGASVQTRETTQLGGHAISRQVLFRRYGGRDVLEYGPVRELTPGLDDVVVEVVAASLNPVENRVRAGAFDPEERQPFPQGNGNDYAGRVILVGDSITT